MNTFSINPIFKLQPVKFFFVEISVSLLFAHNKILQCEEYICSHVILLGCDLNRIQVHCYCTSAAMLLINLHSQHKVEYRIINKLASSLKLSIGLCMHTTTHYTRMNTVTAAHVEKATCICTALV